MNERTTPNDPHLLGDLRAYQFVEFYEEGPGDILTLRDAAYCSIESYRKGDYRECYVDAVVHYDDLAASCLTIHQRGVELHFTDYSIELTGIECPRFLPLLSNRLIRTLDIPPNDYLDTLPPGDYFCHYCGSIRDEQDELTRRARLELPGRPQH